MRAFRLELGGWVFDSSEVKVPAELKFSCSQYSNTDIQQPVLFRLDNPPTEVIRTVESLVAKNSQALMTGATPPVKLVFSAGWTSSPLITRAGLDVFKPQILVNGYINNIQPVFNGAECYVNLAVLSTSGFYDVKKKFQGTLHKGDDIVNFIVNLLKRNFAGWRVTNKILTAKQYTKNTSFVIDCENFEKLAFLFKNEFGIQLNKNAGEIFVFENSKDLLKNTAKTIKYENILRHPSLIGGGETDGWMFEMWTTLDPSLALGQLVVVGGYIPNGDQAINISMGGAVQSYRRNLGTGTYMVIGVKHVGRMYSTDGADWRSELTLVKQ